MGCIDMDQFWMAHLQQTNIESSHPVMGVNNSDLIFFDDLGKTSKNLEDSSWLFAIDI